MNRRGFLWMVAGMLGAETLERSTKVFSFPSKIKIANHLSYEEITEVTVKYFYANFILPETVKLQEQINAVLNGRREIFLHRLMLP